MQKPYLTYTTDKVGAKSLLFKLAAEKNSGMMRSKTVEERRALDEVRAGLRPLPPNVNIKAGPVGGVPCEWITGPKSRSDRVLLYFHGGSWAFGSMNTARPLAVLFAELGDMGVLSVDYRLSPEHPYPAGLEDCCAVYRQLLHNGFHPGRIAVYGDSAGGNLALCMLHALKAERTSMPAAVALASPVTDLREDSALRTAKPDLVFHKSPEGGEVDIFSMYLGEQSPESPTVSPLLGDMAGFPPILIHVGADEPLLEDNITFAETAHKQGVQVICKGWREMFHDFSIVGITLKESRLSLNEAIAFFGTYLQQ